MKDNTYSNLQNAASEEGRSRTLKKGGEWILVFNAGTLESDIIANLKKLVADLDIEDIRYLDSLLLVSGKKSIKVDSNLAEDLVGDRTKSSVIINSMKAELDRGFGYKIYDRGPHRRLAVRLPITEIKDFTDECTQKIKNDILDGGILTPDNIGDILSVYLIADETYVRLDPELFFGEIFDLETKTGKKPAESGPSGRIILGESPQELVELALKKLKGYEIYRDIQMVEAAGLAYSFDACAISDDDRILIKYVETVTEGDVMEIQLFMDAFNAGQGWILTGEQKPGGQTVIKPESDDISIMTMKDL